MTDERAAADRVSRSAASESMVWVDSHCHPQWVTGGADAAIERARAAGRRRDGRRRNRRRELAGGRRARGASRRRPGDGRAPPARGVAPRRGVAGAPRARRRTRRRRDRRGRLRPALPPLGAGRPGGRVPGADPPRARAGAGARHPLARGVGRDVLRCSRRRGRRRARSSTASRAVPPRPSVSSRSVRTSRSAASSRSRAPTTSAPQPRCARSIVCSSRPTRPYLAPVPHRGSENEPAYVGVVGAALAQALDRDLAEVARATTANTGAVLETGPGRRLA